MHRTIGLIRVAVALLVTPLFGAAARLGAVPLALRLWSRVASWAVGLRVRRSGPEPPPGSLLAVNHLGYLDILAVGASAPGRFLAKSEIASWGMLGRIARWGDTVFIDRDRPRDSLPLVEVVASRLSRGQRVVLFPEAGVAPDGETLGPFRPMLFEACVRAARPAVPVALRYTRPADRRVWAWIDEPGLWRHLWRRVLPTRHLEVEVCFGEPLFPGPGEGRKDLATRAREAVGRLLEGDGSRATGPGKGRGGPQ